MAAIKVGFVLLSNSRNPIPSTRIATLNMFPFLREHSFEPHIVFEPTQGMQTPNVDGLLPRLIAERIRIVVFQKVHGASVEALADGLRMAGIQTVFAVCDVTDVPMVRATDATLVVTDYLKSQYPHDLQEKIRVVHDGIEQPDIHKTAWGSGRGSLARPLRAILVTSAHLTCLPVIRSVPSWLQITIVGNFAPTRFQRLLQARWNLVEQRGLRKRLEYLRFLASRRIECVAWNAADVYARMLDADIGIIPIDAAPPHAPGTAPPGWKVKSENRLTMKMAIGLPVIASAIPSYEPVVEQGHNGFLARTEKEWGVYFEALRDPALRESIGRAARASASARYSMQAQARLLIAALRDSINAGVQRNSTKQPE